MIKLTIKFKILKRKKDLRKKKDHGMNHQNFLNRHARHRPRFVTSVRAPLPVAAFRKTPLESKASFSLSIAWNYGLRILVSKRISQPTSLLLLLLVWDYLTESVAERRSWGLLRGTRCWQRQVVVEERRQVHLGFSGSGHRRPAYGTFIYP